MEFCTWTITTILLHVVGLSDIENLVTVIVISYYSVLLLNSVFKSNFIKQFW